MQYVPIKQNSWDKELFFFFNIIIIILKSVLKISNIETGNRCKPTFSDMMLGKTLTAGH